MGKHSNTLIARTIEPITLQNTDRIMFHVGSAEGHGLHINSSGDEITVKRQGTYLIQLNGHLDVSEVPSEKLFITINKVNKLFVDFAQSEVFIPQKGVIPFSMQTLLPLGKGKKISFSIGKKSGGTVVLMEDARLIMIRQN